MSKPIVSTFACLLALLAGSGCSLGAAPGAPAPEEESEEVDRQPPLQDECAPEIASLPGQALGAVALAGDKLYVVGDKNMGASFQLAEIDVGSGAVTPVIQLVSSWNYADWIVVEGDDVSVLEFYPQGARHTFNAVTREVSSAPLTDLSAAPYEFAGQRFWVHVGSGEEDACDNVCIVAGQEGGEVTVLVDDAGEDFRIHNGGVYFFDGWAYFMSYPSASDPPGQMAFRRLPLLGGEVELVYGFEEPANAWIYAPVRDEGGALYWLRVEAEDGAQRTFIDRHDVATNETDVAFVAGLGSDARALTVHDSATLLWTDTEGLRAADAQAGGTVRTLAGHLSGTQARSMYFTLRGDEVFYSRTSQGAGQEPVSVVGCIALDAATPGAR